LLIPIGTGFYPLRGDYGKKDLENANTKAPGGIRVSLWSLSFLPLLNCHFFKYQPNYQK
jgi:hypothetical protein